MTKAHDRTRKQTATVVRGPLWFLRQPFLRQGYMDFKNGLPHSRRPMDPNDSISYEYGRFMACYDSSLRWTDFPKPEESRVSNKALLVWIAASRAGYFS